MRKNKKGSALLWAIAVISVLSVVIAASLSISYSYYHRTLANHDKRQAYFTAKGMIEDIVGRVIHEESDYIALFYDLKEGETAYFNVSFPSDQKLGEISEAKIEKRDKEKERNKITISITVLYSMQSSTIKADLQEGNINGSVKWQLVRYYKDESKDAEETINIKNANIMIGKMSDLLTAYWNPPEGMSNNNALLEKMIKDHFDTYARLMEAIPDYRPYLNNDALRDFFYYMQEDGFIKFELSAVKKESVKDKLIGDLRIQPYFPSDEYKLRIVYASTNATIEAPNWTGVQLIFNPDDGHWYYIEKVNKALYINGFVGSSSTITMTDFDDKGEAGNSTLEKWNRFKANYLIEENRID